MTMVRPCRLITRQRSHIGLTDGRTFIDTSILYVTRLARVVGRKLDLRFFLGDILLMQTALAPSAVS
jgi:hypothetical protein